MRFSIVGASVGSPEWVRDPRGFAVKFYAGSAVGGPTDGCIWDLVGNNFPVRTHFTSWPCRAFTFQVHLIWRQCVTLLQRVQGPMQSCCGSKSV